MEGDPKVFASCAVLNGLPMNTVERTSHKAPAWVLHLWV
jgi:hypothetical protein